MSQLYDMLQEIVDLTNEEKLSLFRDTYLDLFPVFREIDPDTRGMSFICDIIGTAAQADSNPDPSEVRLMRVVTEASGLDIPDEELLKIIQESGTENIRDQVVRLSDLLSPELKARLVMLTAIVCSLDDRINEPEIDLIASLME